MCFSSIMVISVCDLSLFTVLSSKMFLYPQFPLFNYLIFNIKESAGYVTGHPLYKQTRKYL